MAFPESAGLGQDYIDPSGGSLQGATRPDLSQSLGGAWQAWGRLALVASWIRAHAVRSAIPAFLPLALLAIWTVAVDQHVVSRHVLVSPADVVTAFGELWSSGELGRHLSRSLARLFVGFGIGSLAGLTLGVVMGVSRRAEDCLGPTFHAVRQIPSIALIPAFVLILGVDESLKVVLVAKASLFPVALATLHGVRDISRSHLEVAAVYRVPWPVLLRRLVIPSATPAIVGGLRIALSRAWLILVATELIAADCGIGQMMETARQMFRMDVVMVGVFVTGLMGLLFDRSIGLLERLAVRWRRS
jgi:sulfonate transport system permease protein